MEASSPSSATVTLRRAWEGGEAEVTVGISVELGTKPKERHLRLDLLASLHPGEGCLERYKSYDSLLIACKIAAVNGVEHFGKEYLGQFDYRITVLDGRNLPRDCTVGFALAGFIAAARAVGSPGEPGERSYGWKEA